MTLGGHLREPEIAVIKEWIDGGATWDTRVTPGATAVTAAPIEMRFTEQQRRYWAFQKVVKPAAPPVRERPRNPIDAFILAELNATKIKPNPPADKITLLRRATLDLTGLPPSPEEAQEFMADNSPHAFAKVVDRLLASPQYGERWGPHWLNPARYPDTNGFPSDEIRPNISP